MGGPSWLAGILAAIMILTAAYCASRVIIARAHRRPAERDVDVMHTLMGVAMAGMLVSWLNPLPNPVWAVMFGGGTAWFGWRAWRGRLGRSATAGREPHPHHVPHLIMCGAMVYMLLAASTAASAVSTATSAARTGLTMGGAAAAGRFPLLALILAVFMVGYVMWQADRLPALAAAAPTRPAGGGQHMRAYQAGPGTPASQRRRGMISRRLAGVENPPPLADQALSPRLAACCQIAMAVTMGYMLILML